VVVDALLTAAAAAALSAADDTSPVNVDWGAAFCNNAARSMVCGCVIDAVEAVALE